MALKYYSCYSLAEKLGLEDKHCGSCHDDYELGYEDPSPIVIDDMTCDFVCCIVLAAIKEKKLKYEYV